MKSRKRVQRPEPERTRPNRTWSTLYKNASGDGQSGDPVADGVMGGYRVIEEYIRRGQEVAQMVARQGFSPPIGAEGMQDAIERTVRGFADLASFWFSQFPAPGGSGPMGNRSPVKSHGPAVRVRILSPLRTEVSLDLQPGAETRSLVCHPLHSALPKVPPLSALGFERARANGAMCFHLEVPPSQPSGTYSGVVVDGDGGGVRGTVTVRVWDRK